MCCCFSEDKASEANLDMKENSIESLENDQNKRLVSMDQFGNVDEFKDPEEFKESIDKKSFVDKISVPLKLNQKPRFSTPNAMLGTLQNNLGNNQPAAQEPDPSKQLNRGHTYGDDRRKRGNSGSYSISSDAGSALNNAMICGSQTYSQMLRPSSNSNQGLSSHGKSSDRSVVPKMERIEEEES